MGEERVLSGGQAFQQDLLQMPANQRHRCRGVVEGNGRSRGVIVAEGEGNFWVQYRVRRRGGKLHTNRIFSENEDGSRRSLDEKSFLRVFEKTPVIMEQLIGVSHAP